MPSSTDPVSPQETIFSPASWRNTVSTLEDSHELESMNGRSDSRRVSALSRSYIPSSMTTNDLQQYMEFDSALGPQAISPIPEDPEPVVIPPNNSIFHSAEVADDVPARRNYFLRTWGWIKRNPYRAIGYFLGAFLLLGSATILPPVLVKLSHEGDGLSPTTTTNGTSTISPTSTVSSAHSTTTAFSPTGIPAPAACSEHNRVGHVNFLGIANAAGKKWSFQLLAASDATNCCAQCYEAFPQGCQGWAFLPWDNTGVPCNIIFGFPGQDVEDTCPVGHAFVVLGTDQGHEDSFGGSGPCGTTVST